MYLPRLSAGEPILQIEGMGFLFLTEKSGMTRRNHNFDRMSLGPKGSISQIFGHAANFDVYQPNSDINELAAIAMDNQKEGII